MHRVCVRRSDLRALRVYYYVFFYAHTSCNSICLDSYFTTRRRNTHTHSQKMDIYQFYLTILFKMRKKWANFEMSVVNKYAEKLRCL